MRSRIARGLACAFALLGIVGVSTAAHPQTREAISLRYRFASVGIVPGQSLRVTIVNLVENDNTDLEAPEPAQLRLGVEILSNATGRTTFGLVEPPEPEKGAF